MTFRNYSLILSFIVLIALLPGCVFTPVTTTIAVNKDEIKDKIILETFNAVLYFDKADCINELKNELLNKVLCKMRLSKYEQLIEFMKFQPKDIYWIEFLSFISLERDYKFYNNFMKNQNDSLQIANFIFSDRSKPTQPYGYTPTIDTTSKKAFPYLPEIVLNKLIQKGKVRIYDRIYNHYVDSISIVLKEPSTGYSWAKYRSGIVIKGMDIMTDEISNLGQCEEEDKFYKLLP